MSVVKLALKPEAQDQIEKITTNNALWNQYLTQLEAFKKVPSQMKEGYWIEKISSDTILAHTFLNGTPGYKFLQTLWDWKLDKKTSAKPVAILNKIEGLIIGGYLNFRTCISCSRTYEDGPSLCEHLRVHLNNVERSRGREFDDLTKERAGRRQLDVIRSLIRDGKLTHFGPFPKWMSFPPPYSGPSLLKSDNAKPLRTGSSRVDSKYDRSAPYLLKVNQSSQVVPSHKVINGSPNTVTHRLVVAPSCVKPLVSEAPHQLQMETSRVSPHIEPLAIDTTHCLPVAPSHVQSLSDIHQVSQSLVKPIANEAMPLLPVTSPLIKLPHSGIVPVNKLPLSYTTSTASGAPHTVSPLHGNSFTSGQPLLHKVFSSSNVKPVNSGSSLLLSSSVHTNKRKPDALESQSKITKLQSFLKVENPSSTNSGIEPVTSRSSLLLSSAVHTNKQKPVAFESHTEKIKLKSILTVENPSSGLDNFLHKEPSSLNVKPVTSGSSLLLSSAVHTNKRKPDALESQSKHIKLQSTTSGLDTFLHKVPSSSNVKPVASDSSLLPSSAEHTNKRKADALESHSKRSKLHSILKVNIASSTITGLDPQSGHYTPKPASVISKHINVYGASDRVENAIDKFKKFGEDNEKEKKLSSLDILEKLLEEKEISSDRMENKPLWTTLDEKMESPSFDWKNEKHFPHFMANWACLDDCIAKATEHGRVCRGDLEPTVGGLNSPGLTNKEAVYRCTWCKFSYSLRPSPRFQNRGISDYISAFSAETCGGNKSNLKRHYETLGITSPAKSTFLNGDFNIDLLRKLTQGKADEVKKKALQKCLIKNDGSVRLKIDMAHQNRVNSGSSTLTGMDTSTNDILFVNNVHRVDEPISQKHESAAADDMCRLIVRLKLLLQIAITDKGSSAQRVIKQYFPDCIIQWDNWHALKGLEKALKALFGKDEAFEGKIKKIRGHVYWTLNNYKLTVDEYLDPDKRRAAQEAIQKSILNLCRHFQGAVPDDVDDEGNQFHGDCNNKSRCKTNENYVNSRVVLTEEEAKSLQDFLENTDFIRNTDKFLLGLNTSNVESTHRTQNIYRDKTNHLSEEMYNFAIDLATLHSQEMIDGKFENGDRIHEKECSRGPVGNAKRETPKRFFIKDLMGLYFSEIVKSNSAEDEDDKSDSEDEEDETEDEEDETEEEEDKSDSEDDNDKRDSTSEDDSDSVFSTFDDADLVCLGKFVEEKVHVKSHPT